MLSTCLVSQDLFWQSQVSNSKSQSQMSCILVLVSDSKGLCSLGQLGLSLSKFGLGLGWTGLRLDLGLAGLDYITGTYIIRVG